MLNITVLVSGGGTNLQTLLNCEKYGVISNGHINRVISDRSGAYALSRAQEAGVETIIVERSAHKNNESFSKELLKEIKKGKPDLVVLAGFLSVLDKEIIRAFENRIINVHPSLIPSFCGKGFYGLKVHEEVLKRGVKITGATVHVVDESIDGGKILIQKAVEVLEGDTPEALQKRVMEQAEWQILPIAVNLFCNRDEKEPGVLET